MNPVVGIIFLVVCVAVFGISMYRVVKRRRLQKGKEHQVKSD